jgi:hypothetical protein
VLQHEKLHPNLTVWEALMFSALLGLPRTLSYQQKKQRVPLPSSGDVHSTRSVVMTLTSTPTHNTSILDN